MISLGGGNPNPSTFPFSSMSFTLKNGETIVISDDELRKGLQYSPTNGLPDLVSWLKNLQTVFHTPESSTLPNFEICIGNGSQDVLTKAFDAFINKGDYILIDSPAYVGSLAFLKPMGVNFLEVEQDGDGVIPESLEKVLSEAKDRNIVPKVFYTVPVGSNPAGTSTSFERKERVYEICEKYNILILEDDPYYYLQFTTPRIPSYFSLSSRPTFKSRVIRFDSFSKILSAGIRIGWATGPAELIERISLHGQVTTLHASGLSQIVTLKLLQKWGVEGFLKHCDDVAEFYRVKRDVFLKCAEKRISDIATWNIPSAGMFVWINLKTVSDTSDLIKRKAIEKKVLLVPGFEFLPNVTKTSYVRASFSLASEEEIDEALRRLRELILENSE
ncbi:hypothetical protein HK098_006095 [Nowakowskiella sp. JEL0407]|nr:hypothetical protein HK098_006095 [Nowakowskiella sp. JEL0407]